MNIIKHSGSTNSLYLLLCMSFISLLSAYSIQRYQQWKSLKDNLEQILCVKKFHNDSKSAIEFIHRINQIIIAKNIIQLASIFFPQTWVAQPNLIRVKKLLKATQTARLALYYKDILTQMKNGCRLSLNALKTPFKIKGLQLERDFRDVSILRSSELKLCHILSYQIICSQFEIPSSLSTEVAIKSSLTYLPRVLQ